MRSVTLNVDGQAIELPVNFAAGSALSKAGLDPLLFALNTRRGTAALSAMDVITCLHIGVQHSGNKMKLEQLGNAILADNDGLLPYLQLATDYLVAFCQAQPEFPVPKA